ncbi:DNA polymerase nu-like isoform X3 [Pocillopora verrucosa]|uniref:DNA polymerase nu-like isoform X3 n=1 Tax=Pocillopora verrucosa TaxID=203993 RepID=UPI003342C857
MNGPVKRRGGVSLLQDSSFLNQGFQQHFDEEYPSTLQATNYLSRRQMHAERISWEEIQENPREYKNPILFSEPGQRVIRAIRQLYGTRQGAISHSCAPKHASEYYHEKPHELPSVERKEDYLTNQNDLLEFSLAPSCGIQQRLQTNEGLQREEELLSFAGKTGCSSPKEKNVNSESGNEHKNKRKAQQSPITNYFKERKTLQVKEAVKVKPANVNRADASWEDQTNVFTVSTMNPTQREEFRQCLESAEEVACTLIYEDGSSLLRSRKHQKTKKQVEDVCGEKRNLKIAGLVVALPISEITTSGIVDHSVQRRKSRLMVVEIPLCTQDGDMKIWCRTVVHDLMTSSKRKICYGAQLIIRYLIETAHADIRTVCLKWRLFDPKIAAWLLNPDHPPQSFAEVLTSAQLSLPKGGKEDDCMVCRDIAMLGPVMVKQHSMLKALSLLDLFINMEMPICSMLAVMETQGININTQVLIEASNTLKAAGHPFLINSPQQLREVLFEELRLDQKCKKKLARTSIKNYKSTSEAVLLHLQEFHSLPKLVLQYRHLTKLKSTYFDGILSHINEGVLSTNWDQTAAATGRLTSANPNLQSIPKQAIEVSGIKKQLIVGKPEEVVTIYARNAYRSREGWLLLTADFQSIELRLLSHLSEDPSLVQIFNDKQCEDVFTTLASQWLGKSCKEIQLHERERTKRIVYSVIYGVGSEKLGQTLKVSAEEAKGFMESFLGRFPRIKEFTRSSIESCQRKGYVSTILNRRRWLPHIKSFDFTQRSQAERQAVNFIVQGSAADICKAAMIQVMIAVCKDPYVNARLLLQIHDELLLEVPGDEIKRVAAYTKSIMESTEELLGSKVKLKVPLPVTLSIGKTWGHMETLSI